MQLERGKFQRENKRVRIENHALILQLAEENIGKIGDLVKTLFYRVTGFLQLGKLKKLVNF